MSSTDSSDSNAISNDSSNLQQDDNASSKGDEDTLKIVSWNINGMRTLNMEEVLMKQLHDASIVLVQETKLARKQLDQSQVIPSGYSSYFSFSSNRVGYSGVATFCKETWTPSKAEDGLRNKSCCDLIDNVGCYPEVTEEDEGHVKYANADGRTVLTQHVVKLPDGSERPLTIINVYCPRHRDDPEDGTNNTDFKMTFHELLHQRAQLLVENGSFVVLAGDINISHRWIDHCDGNPKTFVATDFRKLLDSFLASGNFVDSFRSLHPDKTSAFTCWNTRLNARQNNYGTRIDYIFLDKQLATYLTKAEIHPDVMGSDHCPISATFHSLRPASPEGRPPPSFATKYFPEFKGKQINLKDFLSSSSSNSSLKKISPPNQLVPETVACKKRPLTLDPKTKVQQNPKRVQTSLKSFFAKNTQDNLKEVLELQETGEDDDNDNTESYSPATPSSNSNMNTVDSSNLWKKLMKAPEVPLCQGHQVPCVRRTVKKKGMNFGREFWSCPHGIGKSDDPNASCNYFQWVKSVK